jgi:hypothetical protein
LPICALLPFCASASSFHKVITHGSNGALEQVKDDGSRVISYRIGSSKECASALRASPLKPPHPARRFTIDGRIVVRYNNGDMKETATDGTITYYYFETGATQIMFPTRPPPTRCPCRLFPRYAISFLAQVSEWVEGYFIREQANGEALPRRHQGDRVFPTRCGRPYMPMAASRYSSSSMR